MKQAYRQHELYVSEDDSRPHVDVHGPLVNSMEDGHYWRGFLDVKTAKAEIDSEFIRVRKVLDDDVREHVGDDVLDDGRRVWSL